MLKTDSDDDEDPGENTWKRLSGALEMAEDFLVLKINTNSYVALLILKKIEIITICIHDPDFVCMKCTVPSLSWALRKRRER